ncbi:MAG: phage portal protein [Candidatus Acidiferrales bacterium]
MKRPGIIDRAMKFFGWQRRDVTVFSGAQGGRLTLDWVASILSADQEIKGNIRLLRARARELSRNNPIVKSYLKLLCANVVGPHGISYKAQVRNKNGEFNQAFNQKIEAAWKDWSKKGTCTADGKYSFRSVQNLVIKNLAVDGEVLVRMVPGFPNKFGFALQTIDADQLDPLFTRAPSSGYGDSSNEIRMGIEVDKWSRPVAYHINQKHPSDLGGSLLRERIPAEFILHLYDPERVNQTRGITWLHPVMTELRMLGGYIEAELVAARVGAAKIGFLKYTDASGFDAPNQDAKYRVEAQPGVIETLPPGMEFQEWSPEHPAMAFPNFVITVMRFIASGLGVSYNALASDLVGVNYSSMRSGMLIERDQWRICQSVMKENFLQSVFENWISMALLSGQLVLDSRDPSRFLAGKWEPRGWQWVDPLKDVQSAILAIGSGLDSRDRILAEKGADIDEVFEQLKEENDLKEEYGLEFPMTSVAPKPPQAAGDPSDPADAGDDDNENENENEDAARVLNIAGRKQ